MRHLLVAVLGLLAPLALAPACNEDSDADIKSFTDQAGRSCTTDAHDIRGTAECDIEPETLVTCKADTVPVFAIGGTIEGELQNCAGCEDAAARTTVLESTTCAFVTCNTDADCVSDRYSCQSSLCKHI